MGDNLKGQIRAGSHGKRKGTRKRLRRAKRNEMPRNAKVELKSFNDSGTGLFVVVGWRFEWRRALSILLMAMLYQLYYDYYYYYIVH